VAVAADGKHFLVVLSRNPHEDDEPCLLPDGRIVWLHDEFEVGGLYEIGSREPLWKFDWAVHKGYVKLSPDGRYAVVINRWGGGNVHKPPTNDVAVIFLKDGREFRSYRSFELVDYPDLMPYNNGGWHHRWVHYDIERREIADGTLSLWTTTHDYYVFDVASGEILVARHLWRHVLWISIVLSVAVAAAAVWRVFRRRAGPALEIPVPPSLQLRFTLRSLLIFTTVVAGLLGLFGIAPRLGVLTLAVSIAGCLTWVTLWLRRRVQHLPRWSTQRSATALLWLPTVAAWLLIYVLSCQPVLRTADRIEDVQIVLRYVPYGPAYWLLTRTSVAEWEVTQWYWNW